MRREEFRSARAGSLVQGIGREGAYDAFVPHPLPPEVEWSTALSRQLERATLAVGRLAGIGDRLANPHLLIRPFMRREAVLSSRIEGTQASLSDLFLFEASPASQRPPSDVREVANYVDALDYALKQTTLPVSLRLIRQMHARLMEGVRGQEEAPGEFRRDQNWIGPAGCRLPDAHYVPPPPAPMLEALDALEEYLHGDDLPALLRLAAVHYQFEAIHPFRDGNGRVGRLLITLLLCEYRLMQQPLLYLSAYFESHRREYYDRLLAVSQQGAWEDWFAFFLEGVRDQAEDAVARALRLDELRRDYYARLQTARSSSLVLKLVDDLFASPYLSVAHAQEVLGVTHRAASQSVAKLLAAGILTEVTGRQRGRIYFASEVLRAVEASLPPPGSPGSGGTRASPGE